MAAPVVSTLAAVLHQLLWRRLERARLLELVLETSLRVSSLPLRRRLNRRRLLRLPSEIAVRPDPQAVSHRGCIS